MSVWVFFYVSVCVSSFCFHHYFLVLIFISFFLSFLILFSFLSAFFFVFFLSFSFLHILSVQDCGVRAQSHILHRYPGDERLRASAVQISVQGNGDVCVFHDLQCCVCVFHDLRCCVSV